MDAQSDTHEWVSVAEAARRRDESTSQVRRLIRLGTLKGEREARGPGDTRDRFRVWVPKLQATPNDAPARADDAQNAPGESPHEIIMAQLTALADAHERVIEAYRMVAERDAAIADLREERGTLTERATDAQQRADQMTDERDEARAQLAAAEAAARERAERGLWRRLLDALR